MSRWSIIALSVLLCTSCSNRLVHQQTYLSTYQNGQLQKAEKRLSKVIKKEIPQGNIQASKEAVWMFLDRATLRFAENRLSEAINDYECALDAIDFYRQRVFTEQVGQFVFDDAVAAYVGEDYEQLLAPVYFALALLQKGDANNAEALLRRAEELQQNLQEQYRRHPLTKELQVATNNLAKYLLALLLERRGDISNARLLYAQSGYKPPKELNPSLSAAPEATVVIIYHNGSAPRKESIFSDVSIASASALEFLLQESNVTPAALSSLTGIPLPSLVTTSKPSPSSVKCNGNSYPLKTLYDVNDVAHRQLEQKKPLIAARAAARLLLRRSAVYAANRQSETLGFATELAMLFANVSTHADTRSWGTLPATIDLLHLDFPAGQNDLAIHFPKEGKQLNYRLNLKQGDLCVINVFRSHASTIQALIHPHFLKQGDLS